MDAEKSFISLFMDIGKYSQILDMDFFHFIIENFNTQLKAINKSPQMAL